MLGFEQVGDDVIDDFVGPTNFDEQTTPSDSACCEVGYRGMNRLVTHANSAS